MVVVYVDVRFFNGLGSKFWDNAFVYTFTLQVV